MKKDVLQNMVLSAVFAAILMILSQIAIPIPPSGIPLTLQTFAVALCGYTLKSKWGCVSVLIYLLLGAAGLPVFANFKGGISALFGPTGGFLLGFLLLVVFCGFSQEKFWSRFLFGFLGVILCHFVGTLQFSLYNQRNFFTSALLISVPFLAKDLLCLVGASFCFSGIDRALKNRRF